MKKSKYVFLLLLCGGLFLTFAVGSSSETSSETSNSKSERFSYTVDNQYSDGFGYYLEGIVTNQTDKDYSYVSIEFICYDADGNNLGTALDNTNSLLANQTWKYKAMFLGTEGKTVDHCDYHETTSW